MLVSRTSRQFRRLAPFVRNLSNHKPINTFNNRNIGLFNCNKGFEFMSSKGFDSEVYRWPKWYLKSAEIVTWIFLGSGCFVGGKLYYDSLDHHCYSNCPPRDPVNLGALTLSCLVGGGSGLLIGGLMGLYWPVTVPVCIVLGSIYPLSYVNFRL